MAPYTVRIFKSIVGNPDIAWANTYEIDIATVPTYEETEQRVSALIAAEAAIHLNIVRFDRATVSTWEPDSKPYDPTALFTYSGFGIVGANQDATTSPEVLDTTLWVRRIASSGRNGRLFYRGVLYDSDTFEDAKRKPGLTVAGANRINTLLDTFKTTLSNAPILTSFVMVGRSQAKKIYNAALQGEKQVVTYEYGPVHTRQVKDFVLGGVSRVKTDNAYFDQ